MTQEAIADEAANARTALLVLGMHRSGTSVLSGVLSRLGCEMPATPIGANPENPKGFYESQPVARLNDAILASERSDWTDWTMFAPSWYGSEGYTNFLGRAVSLIGSEFGDAPLIALKDPRICRLAPFWIVALEKAGYVPRVVLSHRNAEEVAQSLSRRNGFEPPYGRLLWLRHVLDAERDSRTLSRVFVGYDRLIADWRREVSRLAEAGADQLDISEEMGDEIDTFIAPALRHFHAPVTRLSGWVGEVGEILDRWARSGENDADYATLDRIRAALDAAVPTFDPLVRYDPRRSKGRAEQHEATLSALEQETVSLRRGVAKRGEKLLEAEHRIRETQHDLAHLANLQIDLQGRLAEACSARANAEMQAEKSLVKAREALELAELRRRMAGLGAAYTGLKVFRLWKDQRRLSASGIFDADHYLSQNPDIRSSGMNPARHYLLYGCAEGRDPGPDFSTLDYYRRNPDVLAENVNAALHYIKFGHAENRPLELPTEAG